MDDGMGCIDRTGRARSAKLSGIVQARPQVTSQLRADTETVHIRVSLSLPPFTHHHQPRLDIRRHTPRLRLRRPQTEAKDVTGPDSTLPLPARTKSRPRSARTSHRESFQAPFGPQQPGRDEASEHAGPFSPNATKYLVPACPQVQPDQKQALSTCITAAPLLTLTRICKPACCMQPHHQRPLRDEKERDTGSVDPWERREGCPWLSSLTSWNELLSSSPAVAGLR